MNAIGVPVLSLNRERVFGLICGGPSFTASAEHLSEKVGPRLVKIAADLSAPAEASVSALAAR
ncbi:hypothetical protein [Pelagibius marinus]|uniref:hypothetical protein n=1 Tax=Pelagibius marinus TaxID=2762760 RepID=UPI001872CE59|nr:hypothetical protein [Pelagibius marinus]